MSETATMTLAGFLLARIAEALAECEAKRRIVEEEWGRVTRHHAAPPHSRVRESDGEDFIELDGRRLDRDASREFIDRWYVPAEPSRTLKLLAVPYAEHPDYRDEWATPAVAPWLPDRDETDRCWTGRHDECVWGCRCDCHRAAGAASPADTSR